MDRKHSSGKCHLCGNIGKLSLEHVPPRKAFNSNKANLVRGEQLIGRENLPWDLKGLKSQQHQNGIGGNTLCPECNNNTGGWYAKFYVEFANQAFEKLSNIKLTTNSPISLALTNIFPLRVIKQILTMFLSVNNDGFLDKNEEIRELLLQKNAKGINKKKYAIGAYVSASNIAKYVGFSAIMERENIMVISELTAFPFGFVFLLDSQGIEKYCDITNLLNVFEYDDEINLELTLPVYESNTIFPADYRNREQILVDRERNIKWQKNHQ